MRSLGCILLVIAVACGDDSVGSGRDGGGARDGGGGSDATGGSDAGPIADGAAPADSGSTGVRAGPVRLEGSALVDDGGSFVALGATMFWAAWAYKNDRPRLERDLAFLADHGFDYIRALGVVGDYTEADYWDGREIDWHWEDYDAVIAGLTDLAWDTYGLRVEWTLIGDGQENIPDEGDRYAHADRFLAMETGREDAIMHFEIANEAWQNGFDGDAGLAQLLALTAHMRERTDRIVAASAPVGQGCDAWLAMYAGDVADLATLHFDRDLSTVEGGFRPVRLPWEVQHCPGMPVASNNEPIGPGSSVNTESDPTRLAAAAVSTWISGLPFHVFHSGSGVRGDTAIADEPAATAFASLDAIVPPDLSAWERHDALSASAPFVVHVEHPGGTDADRYWPDVADATSGVVRAPSAISGDRFVTLLIGIRDHAVLEPRRAVALEVIDLLTGAPIATETRGAGERFEVRGAEALLVRGTFAD